MKLLLDTHAALWFWWDDPRLSTSAHQAISNSDHGVLVSIASLWEIAIKSALGKLQLGQPFLEFTRYHLHINEFEILPIQDEHLHVTLNLPLYHRDPFDRLLVAQAIHEKAVLVSRDKELSRYGVHCLW